MQAYSKVCVCRTIQPLQAILLIGKDVPSKILMGPILGLLLLSVFSSDWDGEHTYVYGHHLTALSHVQLVIHSDPLSGQDPLLKNKY